MTAYMFCIYSVIRGCCDNPLVDRDLPGERETGNSHDPQAMHDYQEVVDGTPAAHVPKKFVRYSHETL